MISNSRRHDPPATLADIGERGWLEWLERLAAERPSAFAPGFGDDTAWFAPPTPGGSQLLLTTDILVEGTHFTWRTATPSSLGEKTVAVNASDIAAMGGRPVALVVGLGAPPSFPARRLEAVFRSIERACRRWGIALAGGDTVASGQLVLAATLLGRFDGPPENLPLRSRMREGHYIYVTGTLGDSAAGLALLLGGRDRRSAAKGRPWRKALVERHRRPRPRLAEGRALAAALDDLAMIDLSDDLWKSVSLLSGSSGVGATIRLDALPVSPELKAYCRTARRDLREYALFGGEDFELLFATSARPAEVRRILRSAGLETPVRAIGRAGGRKVRWLGRDGRPVAIEPAGFEHFVGGEVGTYGRA